MFVPRPTAGVTGSFATLLRRAPRISPSCPVSTSTSTSPGFFTAKFDTRSLTTLSRVSLTRPYSELSRRAFTRQNWRGYATYRRFDDRGGVVPGGGWGGNNGGGGGGGWGNGRYRWLYQYRHLIAGGAGGMGVFYVYNLEVVEVSGRRRFNCISAEQELQLGKQSYNQIMAEYRGRILPASHPYTRFVDGVMRRLIPFAEMGEGQSGMTTDWEVHVIKDDQMKNAFVLPGGKVFVFTGILPITEDEDGMAAILGHEIAHVVAHHAAERMSSSILAVVAIAATAILFDVSGNLSSMIFNLAFGLPNSRTQEAEADHIGLTMMAKGCYNPQAAVKLWSRMQQAEKGAPPEFLSTHPSSYNRMEAIREWLPAAEQTYSDSGCSETIAYARDFGRAFSSFGW